MLRVKVHSQAPRLFFVLAVCERLNYDASTFCTEDACMVEKDVRGRAGGKARAEILPPARRGEIARAAAQARWGAKATHKGSFKQEFDIDVDCYVIDDPNRTAVISQTGMARALGLSVRGSVFPRFVASKAMSKVAGVELSEKLQKPLKFQWGTGGAEQPPSVIHGFDATLLIDLCKAIVEAETRGNLPDRYAKVAAQSHIILGASAKSGIKGLVYALAGYNPTAEEVISAFKLYVREEAREYEQEFPNQLYEEWYRLYKLSKPPRNKPWKFKHLTIQHVYEPLARSNGRVLELTQAMRAARNERWKKLHQFLSDVGVKALRSQLGQTLGIALISDSKEEYEANINKAFSVQKELF